MSGQGTAGAKAQRQRAHMSVSNCKQLNKDEVGSGRR